MPRNIQHAIFPRINKNGKKKSNKTEKNNNNNNMDKKQNEKIILNDKDKKVSPNNTITHTHRQT